MPIYPSWRLAIFQCFNNFDYERPEAETVTLSTKLIKRGHFSPLCLTPSHSFRLLEWTKPQQTMHTAWWGVLFTAAGAQKTEDSMGINREHWRWHGTLMSKVYFLEVLEILCSNSTSDQKRFPVFKILNINSSELSQVWRTFDSSQVWWLPFDSQHSLWCGQESKENTWRCVHLTVNGLTSAVPRDYWVTLSSFCQPTPLPMGQHFTRERGQMVTPPWPKVSTSSSHSPHSSQTGTSAASSPQSLSPR